MRLIDKIQEMIPQGLITSCFFQMMENDVTDLNGRFERIFAQNLTPSGQFNQEDYLPLHFIYTSPSVTNLSALCYQLNCTGKGHRFLPT